MEGFVGAVAAWLVAAGAIIGAIAYISWRLVYWVPADSTELGWIADDCKECPAAKEYIRRVLAERDYLMKWDWHETYRLYQEMNQDKRNAERQARMERIREAVK